MKVNYKPKEKQVKEGTLLMLWDDERKDDRRFGIVAINDTDKLYTFVDLDSGVLEPKGFRDSPGQLFVKSVEELMKTLEGNWDHVEVVNEPVTIGGL